MQLWRQWPHLVEEALHRGRVPIGFDERVQRLNETPHRRVDVRGETGVHVGGRATAPLRPARHQFELHDPLRPEVDFDGAAETLVAERDDHARAFLQCGLDLGLEDDLREVRRSDLLLPLAHEDEVHGELLARCLERMQRGEQGNLRSLGVGRTTSDNDGANAGPIDQPPLERRRRPLARIELLHVVHEVDAQRRIRAGIQRGEHPRLALGRDDLDALESGVARQPRHVLRALRVIQVFGGDRRQCDPVLQHLQGCGVARGNLSDNRGAIRVASLRPIRPVDNGKRRRTSEGRLQELASVDHVSILVSRKCSSGTAEEAGSVTQPNAARRPDPEKRITQRNREHRVTWLKKPLPKK